MGGLAAIRRVVFAYPGVKGSESGSRCCRVAVSSGWDELERYGGACQLANLPTCQLANLSAFWLVGKLVFRFVGKSGSWRSAAGFWFTRRVSEEGVAGARAGRGSPANAGRTKKVCSYRDGGPARRGGETTGAGWVRRAAGRMLGQADGAGGGEGFGLPGGCSGGPGPDVPTPSGGGGVEEGVIAE